VGRAVDFGQEWSATSATGDCWAQGAPLTRLQRDRAALLPIRACRALRPTSEACDTSESMWAASLPHAGGIEVSPTPGSRNQRR
jgi:hypothetical protein